MNDEGVPVDQYGNEDINWYGGDHGMANMFWEILVWELVHL